MNKLKLFISNFLVYGIGGVISGIIQFLMVPIVTRIMPNTGYFGISELAIVVVQFGSSFAIFGMYDAMFRLFFDDDNEHSKKKICSTTLLFNFINTVIVTILIIIFRNSIARLFLDNQDLNYIIIITAFTVFFTSTNAIVSAPTRMQNKKKIFLITNSIGPIVSYSIAIPLLLNGYYYLALPFAAMLSSIIIEIIFVFLNKKWFDFRLFDKKIFRDLLKIAIPIVPNFLIYWLFNSCDRLMITNILGVDDTGIYSAGAKIGQCSQLLYVAFAGGWQFFSFSTMKENDQVKNNSKVFEYLGIIAMIISMIMCLFSYNIFKLFFSKSYLEAYSIAPYLFIIPLLQMLFQISANQFLIVKKTWPNLFILSIGAIINIVINFVFIPKFGAEGAAIASLIGYLISVVLCCITLVKMKLMVVEKKFVFAMILFIIYFVSWRVLFSMNLIEPILFMMVILIVCYLMYKDEIIKGIELLKERK